MEPKIYTSKDHHIRNDHIDPHALTVLKKLHDSGFVAYLVGGSVRDLLMHQRPKDFDIATSALPEEVKKCFRSCLLIGRRFRLAHVRFGKQVIEVSTFRAGDPTEEDLIVRDNLWGTPEEDVLRRDFTINGLFYDPLDHRIIDYVGGFEDLNKHLLRSIGEPILRFKQDPVRMIRMQKFQARFGFNVDSEARKALELCREEIVKSSPARVLEEIFRMLESGSAEAFFRLLHDSALLAILFPKLNAYFEDPKTQGSLFAYLQAVDAMNLRGHYRVLDRAILTAALVYPVLEHEIAKLKTPPHIGELIELSYEIIHELLYGAFSHFPRKLRQNAHFILHMQYRLTPLDQKRRPRTRIASHKHFILPLTFLKLRALVEHTHFKSYDFWKRLWKQGQEEE